MSHLPSASRIVGNLAAVAGIVLTAAWGIDQVGAWLGYRPMTFCTLLRPVTVIAYEIGVLMTCIGLIMWVVSLGKSETGLGLTVGGFLLFALPLVLPRYLCMTCLP